MHKVLLKEADRRAKAAEKVEESKFKESCPFRPDLALTQRSPGDGGQLTFQRAKTATFRAGSK